MFVNIYLTPKHPEGIFQGASYTISLPFSPSFIILSASSFAPFPSKPSLPVLSPPPFTFSITLILQPTNALFVAHGLLSTKTLPPPSIETFIRVLIKPYPDFREENRRKNRGVAKYIYMQMSIGVLFQSCEGDDTRERME